MGFAADAQSLVERAAGPENVGDLTESDHAPLDVADSLSFIPGTTWSLRPRAWTTRSTVAYKVQIIWTTMTKKNGSEKGLDPNPNELSP